MVVAWALAPASAWGADPAISVACPAWAPESTAEVEARIRTVLLTELPAASVRIECGSAQAAAVVVTAGAETRQAQVEHQSPRLEDDVVAAVNKLVAEIAASSRPKPAPVEFPEPAPPPPEPEPVPQPKPKPAKVVAKAEPPPPAPVVASTSELTVGGMLELWGTDTDSGGASWAAGALAALSTHRGWFHYGIGASWVTALSVPATFSAREWRVQGRLGFDLWGKSGVTLGVAAGVGILVASPQTGVSTVTGTALSAGSLQLTLGRSVPIARDWSLAPFASVLAHSAPRNVRVNAKEQLAVPMLVPSIGLFVSYASR